jgi:hypothetical protein
VTILLKNRHDGQNQEDVDEPSHGVGRNEANGPKNEQNHRNCPEHVNAFLKG